MIRRALALLLCLLPAAAAAAPPASLVADSVSVAADGTLVAEGAVEVMAEGVLLTAARVTYDPARESLVVEGPIVLSQDGRSVILADAAELSAGLREGIVTSARLVLDRRLQFAAGEIARGGARFTRLSRVTASACTICETGETPLWEIRARSVIRDAEELQIYFEDAQLRVMGVPVFWAPRLRLPDPALERSPGFLTPEIRSRSGLGVGPATPYFLPLGPHADLTFTPYLTSRTRTLEARYRRELSFGRLTLDAALSEDDLRDGGLRDGGLRAYLFAEGRFRLPRGFALGLDAKLVSDSAYLSDYGYSDADRLESSLSLERVTDAAVFDASLSAFRSLRDAEERFSGRRPGRIAEIDWSRRLLEDPLWGEVWVSLSGAGLERASDEPGRGRDTARLTAAAEWSRSEVFASGLVGTARARLTQDRYWVSQDPAFASPLSRTTPAVSAALAFPMQRSGPGGVRQLLEPKVQLTWSRVTGDRVPNEDSSSVEFDEGNLFAFDRYPGDDRREDGLRFAAGLTWTRLDPGGWEVSATAGRIYRFDGDVGFGDVAGREPDDGPGPAAGLAEGASDWLLAGGIDIGQGFSADSRAVVGDDLTVTLAESRLDWQGEAGRLTASHLWRDATASPDLARNLSEVELKGAWSIDPHWTVSGQWRFDAATAFTTRTGLGLSWQNECLGVDLSLSRRYTTSSNVDPSTQVDLRLFLVGFGGGGDPRVPARRCNG